MVRQKAQIMHPIDVERFTSTSYLSEKRSILLIVKILSLSFAMKIMGIDYDFLVVLLKFTVLLQDLPIEIV